MSLEAIKKEEREFENKNSQGLFHFTYRYNFEAERVHNLKK